MIMYYEVPYVVNYNCRFISNNNSNTKDTPHFGAQSVSMYSVTATGNHSGANTPTIGGSMRPIEIQNARWYDIVSTAMGYQSFMNHLETEFSIENLLFVTEYIQIKNVSKIKFDDIFANMYQDNNTKKKIEFNVPFPGIDESLLLDESNDSHNNSSDRDISIIATVNTVTTPPVSLIAKQLYNDSNIINAFQCLYNKYIDPQNAPFMINISSTDRKQISEAFTEKNKTRSRSWIQSMPNLHSQLMVRPERDSNAQNGTNTDGVDERILVIEEEYKKHHESIEWLLVYLLSRFDNAAREVSQLMHDAFRRYKHHGVQH